MNTSPSFADDIPLDPSMALLELLSDWDLAAWYRRTMLAYALSPKFTLRRYRWRRAHKVAASAFGDRVRRQTTIMCDRCGKYPPVSHEAVGEADELQFAHYCRGCAPLAPHGWFVTWAE